MWQQLFLGFLGLCSGIVIASGVAGLLIGLSIIPRYAGITHTGDHVMLYEDAALLGIIFGNLFVLFRCFPSSRLLLSGCPGSILRLLPWELDSGSCGGCRHVSGLCPAHPAFPGASGRYYLHCRRQMHRNFYLLSLHDTVRLIPPQRSKTGRTHCPAAARMTGAGLIHYMYNQQYCQKKNKKDLFSPGKEKVMTSEEYQKNPKEYEQYVKSITPSHSLAANMAKAFLTGGLICTAGQWILNTARELGADAETAGSWCSLILIFLSVLLTGLNIYPKIGKFGGAGGLVPITGFANSVASSAIEFRSEGQIFGIGCKIFTIAGPVILYGILSSWGIGIIYYLFQFLEVTV